MRGKTSDNTGTMIRTVAKGSTCNRENVYLMYMYKTESLYYYSKHFIMDKIVRLTRSRPIGLGESILLVVFQWLVPAQGRTQDHDPRTCGGQHNTPARVRV